VCAHEVWVSQNGRSGFSDRHSAVVRDELIDGVEVRRVVPQVVLKCRRPKDAEMLHAVVYPEQTDKQTFTRALLNFISLGITLDCLFVCLGFNSTFSTNRQYRAINV